MKKDNKNLMQITEGVIWKQLLSFFFPIMLGTFFQQLYNTIDAIIVGQFIGKEALASVGGSTGQIITLVVGFFTGLTSGAGVIISQFFGSKNKEMVRQSIHTAYIFSIIGSIFMTIIGILLTPAMLKAMHTSAELMEQSTIYMRIYFGGILFVFIYNAGSSILRAIGDSKHPLYYLIICCIINIILDIVMVAIFQWGVAGVAIATLISQAVSAVLVTRKLMLLQESFHLSFSNIHLYPRALKLELYIGLPEGFQSVMYSLSNVIIQTVLNDFGTDTIAAWTIYGKIDAIFWMISSAFGISITTFVGQNFGARKYKRIKKSIYTCLSMNFFAAVLLAVFLITTRVFLFQIFTNDKNVIEIGTNMIKIVAPCYVFFVFIEVLSGALRGMGDVLVPLILTMCGICILRIAWVIIITPIYPKVSSIILSYPITWILTAILFVFYYFYKRKQIFQADSFDIIR